MGGRRGGREYFWPQVPHVLPVGHCLFAVASKCEPLAVVHPSLLWPSQAPAVAPACTISMFKGMLGKGGLPKGPVSCLQAPVWQDRVPGRPGATRGSWPCGVEEVTAHGALPRQPYCMVQLMHD